jgi:hypothetical protein
MALAEGTDGTLIIAVDKKISIGDAKVGHDSDSELDYNGFQPPNVASDQVTPAFLGVPDFPQTIPVETNTCPGRGIHPDTVVSGGGSWSERVRRVVIFEGVKPPFKIRYD